MKGSDRCNDCGKTYDEHRTVTVGGTTIWLCDQPPRIARSLDDLKIGMWVAWKEDHGWETELISEEWYSTDWDQISAVSVVVILEEPSDKPELPTTPSVIRALLRRGYETLLFGPLKDGWWANERVGGSVSEDEIISFEVLWTATEEGK